MTGRCPEDPPAETSSDTLIPVQENLSFQSFLRKRKDTMKFNWATYWFKLQNTTLYFYTNKEQQETSLRGQYYMFSVQSVRSLSDTDGDFTFEIVMKNGKRKLLSAESAELRDVWVRLLWKSMQLPGPGRYKSSCTWYDIPQLIKKFSFSADKPVVVADDNKVKDDGRPVVVPDKKVKDDGRPVVVPDKKVKDDGRPVVVADDNNKVKDNERPVVVADDNKVKEDGWPVVVADDNKVKDDGRPVVVADDNKVKDDGRPVVVADDNKVKDDGRPVVVADDNEVKDDGRPVVVADDNEVKDDGRPVVVADDNKVKDDGRPVVVADDNKVKDDGRPVVVADDNKVKDDGRPVVVADDVSEQPPGAVQTDGIDDGRPEAANVLQQFLCSVQPLYTGENSDQSSDDDDIYDVPRPQAMNLTVYSERPAEEEEQQRTAEEEQQRTTKEQQRPVGEEEQRTALSHLQLCDPPPSDAADTDVSGVVLKASTEVPDISSSACIPESPAEESSPD